MSLFENLLGKLRGQSSDDIRPLKNILPNGVLTDTEVCHYLIQGSDIEQTRTEEWLYYQKFSETLAFKIRQYFDLKEEITYAYDDAVHGFLVNIRKGAFQNDANLKTYFNKIFDNKVNDIFQKKKTTKSKEEKQWYANRDAAIEEKFCNDFNLITPPAEPNHIEELLDLFEQKKPHVARWIRLIGLGWKDEDFVGAGMSANDNSARSYVKNCKNQFEQFLKENNTYFNNRGNTSQNGTKASKNGIKTLALLVIFTIFKQLNI